MYSKNSFNNLWAALGALISSFLMPSAWAGIPVAVSVEMDHARGIIARFRHDMTLDPTGVEQFAWTEYLGLLESGKLPENQTPSCTSFLEHDSLLSKDSPSNSATEDQFVDPQHRDQFLNLLKYFYRRGSSRIPFRLDSLYENIVVLETCKSVWDVRTKPTLPLWSNDGAASAKIHRRVQVGPQGGLYVDLLEDNVLGEGASKVAEVWVNYSDLTEVTHIRLKNELFQSANQPVAARRLEAAKGRFKRETEIYSLIMQNWDESQILVGLPDALFVDQDEMILPRHPSTMDLFSVVNGRSFSHFSLADRFAWIEQLVHGIVWLHNKGIAHSDIKLENALLAKRNSNSKMSAFHIDFDRSYSPKKLLTLNGPPALNGTSYTFAPEQGEGSSWKGADQDLKIRNALKVDVFSMAVVAYMTATGHSPKFNSNCDRFDPKRSFGNWWACRNIMLDQFFAFQRTSNFYHPAIALFEASWETNPEFRITSEQLLHGIQHVQSILPKAQYSTFPGPSQFFPAQGRWVPLASAGSGGSFATGLEGKPRGTFCIHKDPNSQPFMLSFVDRHSGAIQTKNLSTFTTDPESIAAEIQFLKKIGTLSDQISEEECAPQSSHSDPTPADILIIKTPTSPRSAPEWPI